MTRDWSKRINISLFSICIVDTWFAYTGILQEGTECQNDFYGYLVKELSDNRYDEMVGSRGRLRSEDSPSRRLIMVWE